jgi:Nuclease-related domain
LQRRLEDVNDSFNFWFMEACFLSLPALGVFAITPKDTFGRILFLVCFGLAAAGCAVMAWRRLKQIRDYRRGLAGEQAVAEQLQPLFASGYRVFHDIPCENGSAKWNIDHVAVGAGGVFAIETKYRTKRPGRNGGRDQDATYDGHRIEFASGDYDAKAVG